MVGYLVEFEIPCFQEAWDEALPLPLKIDLICQGVQQNFARKIGELSFENRRVKLLRYLAKKYGVLNIGGCVSGEGRWGTTAERRWLTGACG